MSTLGRLRHAPWLAGAVTLVFVAALLAPLAARFGLGYWPFYAGMAAALLLLAGWVERLWRSRPVSFAAPRSARRGRFRVLRGGKGGRKGNGRDSLDLEEDDDGPRWLM